MSNIRWKCQGKKSAYHFQEYNKGFRCKKENCSQTAPLSYIIRLCFSKSLLISRFIAIAAGITAITASSIFFIVRRSNDDGLLIVHIVDESGSARNNDNFSRSFEKTCETVAKVIRTKKDRYSRISVYSEVPEYQDPITISSRQTISDNCRLMSHSNEEGGTLVCPAWTNASNQIDVVFNEIHPLIITQVHTNEYESFCPEVVDLLYDKILENDGMHLIVGSTNDGDTSFNSSLFTYVSNSENQKVRENTLFLNLESEKCLREAASYLRREKSIDVSKSTCIRTTEN